MLKFIWLLILLLFFPKLNPLNRITLFCLALTQSSHMSMEKHLACSFFIDNFISFIKTHVQTAISREVIFWWTRCSLPPDMLKQISFRKKYEFPEIITQSAQFALEKSPRRWLLLQSNFKPPISQVHANNLMQASHTAAWCPLWKQRVIPCL